MIPIGYGLAIFFLVCWLLELWTYRTLHKEVEGQEAIIVILEKRCMRHVRRITALESQVASLKLELKACHDELGVDDEQT